MNKNDMNFLEEWDVIIPSDYYPDKHVLHSDIHTAILHDVEEDEPSNNMEAPFTNVPINDFNFVKFLIARNCKQFREKQAMSATTQSANTKEDEKKKINTECGSSSKMIEIDSHIKSEQDQDTAKPETVTKDTSSSRDIDEYFGDRCETATGCFIPTILSVSSSIELEKSSSTSSEESVTSSETYFSIPLDPEEIKDNPKNSESSYYDPKNDSADDTDQSASTCVNFWYDWIAHCLKCRLHKSLNQWIIIIAMSLTVSLMPVNENYKNSNIESWIADLRWHFPSLLPNTEKKVFRRWLPIKALHQEENVSLIMQEMMNELRNDYKLLKEQMLSEMKNDKLVSSITHQIRELKKENYELKFALYEVVNKIEKQKYSQEKLLEKNENIHDPPAKIDDWSPIICIVFNVICCILYMCIFYFFKLICN